MILQNDTVWLGGEGIGESLIPNQGPVSAGSACIFLSSACWGVGTCREAQALEGWPGKACLSPSRAVSRGTVAQGGLRAVQVPVVL